MKAHDRPERPVLESTEHVWISIVAAGLVLLIAGVLSGAAPPPGHGAVVVALGVLFHAVEVFASRRENPDPIPSASRPDRERLAARLDREGVLCDGQANDREAAARERSGAHRVAEGVAAHHEGRPVAHIE
jgi:hypothetical protein